VANQKWQDYVFDTENNTGPQSDRNGNDGMFVSFKNLSKKIVNAEKDKETYPGFDSKCSENSVDDYK
jgi:hypothetical protein